MRRRRRNPTPTTPSQTAAYERAGQQCLPGIEPLPQRALAAKRVAAQALAVTEHTAKIFQELRKDIVPPKDELPLMPEASHAQRPLTFLELAGQAAPWFIMVAVVCIVVFRASVTEVSYAVRITGVPKPVVVGFLAWLALPAAINATWLLWRRLSRAIKPSQDPLVRIARAIAIISVIVVAQLPSFITYTQSHEAARYVAASIYRAVANALFMPDFKDYEIKQPPPARKR